MAVLGNTRRVYIVTGTTTLTYTWLAGEQTNSFNRTAEGIDTSDKSTVWAQFLSGKKGATAEVTVFTDDTSTEPQHAALSALHLIAGFSVNRLRPRLTLFLCGAGCYLCAVSVVGVEENAYRLFLGAILLELAAHGVCLLLPHPPEPEPEEKEEKADEVEGAEASSEDGEDRVGEPETEAPEPEAAPDGEGDGTEEDKTE